MSDDPRLPPRVPGHVPVPEAVTGSLPEAAPGTTSGPGAVPGAVPAAAVPGAEPARAAAPPPEWIGPYRPVERIGAGGMGQVFRAVAPDGSAVAVKTLHPHLVDAGDARTRLRREVETMGRVTTPRVAKVLSFDVDSPVPYVVTRYVGGRPLLEEVRTGGPLTGEALWRVATGTAEALEAIHRAGVVHRDIKPGNVLLEDGEPVVIDFGISQGVDDTRLTHTGGRSGTWRYLAPELLEGEDAGPGADVFAWAATVAFAATGRDLYDAPNDAAVCVRIIRGDHDLSDVPEELRGLLAEALASDPARRPGADVLVRRLRALRPDSVGTGMRVSGGGGPVTGPRTGPRTGGGTGAGTGGGTGAGTGGGTGGSARPGAGAARSRPPARIGPYRPLQRLGKGGMGEVFLARADDGRMVAIKTLLPLLPAEFHARDRLWREVEAMRRIRDPHVVELVDHDLDADPPYIVTHYVEGTALLDLVRRNGPLERDALLRLAGGLAGALEAVHAARSVHRDINPGNVMMVAGGEPVVIDFGIAHLAGADPLTRGPVGTPGYVAPEVVEGRQAGPAADVFGWAATVAFAATGRRAYEATSPAAFVRRVLTGEPDLAGIDPDLREVLQDCLVRDPEQRPGAAELNARFINPGSIAPRLHRPKPKPAPPPPPPEPEPPLGGREAFLRAGMALTLPVIEVSLQEVKRELAVAERLRALGGTWADDSAAYARRTMEAAARTVRDARNGTGVPANAPRLAEIIRAAQMYGAHARSLAAGVSLPPSRLADTGRVVALLAGARFTRVRFKEGYDPAEVDAFLGRLRIWLGGDRRELTQVIGADDVRAREFTVRRLRETYLRGEVDAFKATLEAELRRLGYA